jgi:hypothetical protein
VVSRLEAPGGDFDANTGFHLPVEWELHPSPEVFLMDITEQVETAKCPAKRRNTFCFGTKVLVRMR